MNAIPLSKAAEDLGRVINDAREGGPVMLIQDGCVVAELRANNRPPQANAETFPDAAEAIERILKRRASCRLGDLAIRELKELGRL